MTNKEAINLISRNESVFQFDPAMLEALDLAIKALKEIPTVEYPFYAEAYQTGYEEAIKEIKKWLDGCPFENTKEAFILAIKALQFINENYPKTFIDYLNGVQI